MPPKLRRIAIMGFRSVGKSSITIQFVDNQFVDSYDPTIENTFTKTVKLRGQEYQLKLIDTAGQDEYSIVPNSYAMNIDGYVLVYSVTSRKSFEVVKVIYDKILDLTGKNQLPLVLVGNKTDLRMEREISFEDGKRLSGQWKSMFLETSAKENQKVADIFHSIVYETEKAEGNIKEPSSCVLS
ncbi:GTP-binding protein Rheb-like protein [Lamellibrachia satsuma]|nr:GTP-binding protein Rheb-like protein [Lamellibrachia satsuma]